jgi:hypothetical protein
VVIFTRVGGDASKHAPGCLIMSESSTIGFDLKRGFSAELHLIFF